MKWFTIDFEPTFGIFAMHSAIKQQLTVCIVKMVARSITFPKHDPLILAARAQNTAAFWEYISVFA